MNNQQYIVRPTLIDLSPDKISFYPFIVSLNTCNVSCSTVEDLFGRIFISNKMEDVNLKVFNVIIGLNESKTLTKTYIYIGKQE